MWTQEAAQMAIELAWGYEGWGHGPSGGGEEMPGPTGFRNLAARYYLEAHASVELLSGLRAGEWSQEERLRWTQVLREMAEALESGPKAEGGGEPAPEVQRQAKVLEDVEVALQQANGKRPAEKQDPRSGAER